MNFPFLLQIAIIYFGSLNSKYSKIRIALGRKLKTFVGDTRNPIN
jgi:hypothetical protein